MHYHLSGPRKVFEHKADRPSAQDTLSVNAMKQTCVFVILANVTLFQTKLH